MSEAAADQGRQELAERVAEAMIRRNSSARLLGISLDEVGWGRAVMSMAVSADMLNGVDIGHGGITFTLADTAFAFACNSHNRPAVALSCSITYPNAAHLGDRLTARCHEVHRKGRNGTYDCTVTNQNGDVIALFRGQCRILEGHIVEGNP